MLFVGRAKVLSGPSFLARWAIRKTNGPPPPHRRWRPVASCDGFSPISGEESADGLGLDQLARLLEVVIDDRRRVDAEGVVDRRQQFARVDRVFQRGRPGLIRLAVDVAALDA